MKSSDIRKAFLDYFESQAHKVVNSSSLIPRDDPSLLFTNAGMVQFKSVFTGEEARSYTRAASCQKCMRAGGKHNDIENVGHTARHHTFFEMLGNFSFGDYFKKDAIVFAWDLLSNYLKLPANRLWVSVFEKDDEALNLWVDHTGIPADRVVKLGEKDNFWQMGDTGPCGPCSEILIDQGAEIGCGKAECAVGCDCDRFLEIWNLVFMQYNKDEEGNLHPLPKPSIDTGMGLERITAVLQEKKNNFDTDLFLPIISAVSAETGIAYCQSSETDISLRVIADHIRATAFLLSEGLMPSNEGRGYVLRRVLRRASRHARLMGIEDPILYKLVDAVIETMGDVYQEIVDEKERTKKILMVEEQRFIKTLQQGINRLDLIIEELKRSNSDTISGDEIFKLYDTFGFPIDLARDMAIDSGVKIDEEGFKSAMKKQREVARASWTTEDIKSPGIYHEMLRNFGQTEFVGYESLESRSRILAILKDSTVQDEIHEGEEAEVITNISPFYGESGGQVGDTGVISSDNAKLTVLDTWKPVDGLYVHHVKVKRGRVNNGENVFCEVSKERRKAIMRNHTATHLLHASLKNTLGDHIKQSGSLVSDEKLRFDFTHFSALNPDEIKEVENMVNMIVLDNRNVKKETMKIEEALASGAAALFDEKYGDTVRVISVENFSKELCGGTHCSGTGEIGPFVITSEGSVASGIRRIEAITGENAIEYLRQKERDLESLSDILKTDKPLEKVKRILEELKTAHKEIEHLKTAVTPAKGPDITESAKDINGTRVLALRQDDLSPNELRTFSDNIKEKLKSGVILIASVRDNQASILCTVTNDLQKKLHAGEILKKIVDACGGRGGGKSHMAQGGTKDISKLDKALNMVYDIVRDGI